MGEYIDPFGYRMTFNADDYKGRFQCRRSQGAVPSSWFDRIGSGTLVRLS